MDGLKQEKSCIIWILFFFICHATAQTKYHVEKLGPHINSSQYDEISPVVTRDGNTLYFTRVGTPEFNRTLIQEEIDISKTLSEADYMDTLRSVYSQIALTPVLDPIQSKVNQDIWIADTKSTTFDHVYQPGFPINNALPNSVCSLFPTENTLVIINHFMRDGSMYNGFSTVDRKSNGSFSFPEPIYIRDFYSFAPEVNLCMSRDGDVVILSLQRKQGYGNSDLFVCFKLKDNLWSEPMNMGPVINSADREITPFLSSDKTRLFFASNRPGGKGGMDIYVSRRLDFTYTSWSVPQRLIEDINSESDDSNPVVVEPDPESSIIYFISRRDGSSDIFQANLLYAENIDQPITIRGTIRNSITKEPMNADLFFGPSRLAELTKSKTAVDGKYEIVLDKKEIIRLSPQKQGFIGKNQLVDLQVLDTSDVKTYEVDFFLTPLLTDQKIEIDNIYFERGKPIILESSYPELDKLSELLTQNPSLQIRIEGHTDSVGNYYELLDLSRNRADAIKKYLVLKKAIGSNRITTIGYGGTKPISNNNSEENRAKNRRVEIYVISANLARKLNKNDILDPTVKPIKPDHDDPIVTSQVKADFHPRPESSIQNGSIPPQDMNSKSTMQTIHDPSKDLKPVSAIAARNYFSKIVFLNNALAIKQTSFNELNRLIDYLKNYPDYKIMLVGQTSREEDDFLKNPAEFAMQRAKGIREYFIINSIPANRIVLGDSILDAEFSGVLVLLDK